MGVPCWVICLCGMTPWTAGRIPERVGIENSERCPLFVRWIGTGGYKRELRRVSGRCAVMKIYP